MGFEVTKEELSKISIEFDKGEDDLLKYEEFYEIMQKKIYSVDSKFEAEIVTSEKVEGRVEFSSPNKLPYNIKLNISGMKPNILP